MRLIKISYRLLKTVLTVLTAADLLTTLEQTPTKTATNTSQNESIDPNDALAYYNQGLAAFVKDGQYGFIDRQGKIAFYDVNCDLRL